jgi:hypothetical protein
MANPQPEVTIRIADFRAGITDTNYRPAGGAGTTDSATSPATANADGTRGCCADPITGALIALPRRQTRITQAGITIGNDFTANYYPSDGAANYITDIAAFGPLRPSSYHTMNENSDTTVVALAYTWLYRPAGTGTSYMPIELVRAYYPTIWAGTPVQDFHWGRDTDIYSSMFLAGGLVGPSLCRARSDSVTPPRVSETIPILAFLASRRFNASMATGAIAANELGLTSYDSVVSEFTAGALHTANTDYPRRNVHTYPDPSDVTATRTNGFDIAGFPYMILSHQGRGVFLTYQDRSWGALNSARSAADYVIYTQPADWVDPSVEAALYVEENPTPYGTAASLNANELLLIKRSGGGVLVRGDLDNPSVIRLPYIESTGDLIHYGTPTPIGFVYGSRNGIFAWAGGDQSICISDQLRGFFWDHTSGTTAEKYATSRGRFGFMYPWIFVPNDFIFDTRTKSWWRTRYDPTNSNDFRLNCFDVDPASGHMLAARYKINGTATTAVDYFDPDVRETSYVWTSHPIVNTADRQFVAQEIELVAATHSSDSIITVKVDAWDTNPATSDPTTPASTTVTFTFNDAAYVDSTVKIKKDIAPNVTGRYVRLTVTSTDNGSVAAPDIFSLTVTGREGVGQAKVSA